MLYRYELFVDGLWYFVCTSVFSVVLLSLFEFFESFSLSRNGGGKNKLGDVTWTLDARQLDARRNAQGELCIEVPGCPVRHLHVAPS